MVLARGLLGLKLGLEKGFYGAYILICHLRDREGRIRGLVGQLVLLPVPQALRQRVLLVFELLLDVVVEFGYILQICVNKLGLLDLAFLLGLLNLDEVSQLLLPVLLHCTDRYTAFGRSLRENPFLLEVFRLDGNFGRVVLEFFEEIEFDGIH